MDVPPRTEAFPGRRHPTLPELDEVVLEAAVLEGAERDAYLRRIEGADPELAEHARRRLRAAHASATSFLADPAAARLLLGIAPAADGEPAPPRAAALPPEERYELGEVLGRGGMGRVVAAHDRQLGRRVALKFLATRDPSLRQLFLREGRAQARVRHEHVLDVYDSGELDGQPFLAMRLVDGGTLAEVAPDLTLEGKIRLLVQVAEGLHAAHRTGLLHRDVKPANILVETTQDGDRCAFVSDFGIAADAAEGDRRAGGSIPGSPHYIAPERLEDDAAVDRRSDVYSLGMTMYRVLVGRLPFGDAGTFGALRRSLRSEVPPPRSVDPRLPAEVEAIVLRCLERDPAARYGSARAVAEDLRRYLDGEVVEAYTAGLAYRLTRFVLRHRLLVTVTGLAAGALAVAAVAVAVLAVQADAAREQAVRRQGQAEELIRFMVVDLQEKLEATSRLAVLDDVARAAADYFGAVPETELSDEELLRRSRMLYQLGNLRIEQGDLAGAAAPLAESLALARRLHELDPDDPERLFELGQSWFWVGYVAWQRGDLAAARGAFEEYLAVSRRLIAADPDRLDWQLELSYALSNLGSVLQMEGRIEEALERFRQSLAMKRRLVRARPDDRSWRRDLAASHNTVGVALLLLGHSGPARGELERELALREALLAEAPEDRRLRGSLALTHLYLGKTHAREGRWRPAREHAETSRELLAELVAHDPESSTLRNRLVWTHVDLGRFAYSEGEIAAAEREWREAEALVERHLELGERPVGALWRRAAAVLDYHAALTAAARGDPSARDEVLAAIEQLETLGAERSADLELVRWWGWSQRLLADLEPPAAAEAARTRADQILEPFRAGRTEPPGALCAELADRAGPRAAAEAATLDPLYCALALRRPGVGAQLPG